MAGFKDIAGHEKIKEHLHKAIETDRVSHAYLFSGEAGMGRKTLAKAFAMTLLCEEGGSEPCLKCHACRQVMSGNHPDLLFVGHEKQASIGVDDIRKQIHDTIMIRPYSGGRKIYIVDEAEKMTVQAQNALLKVVEEPPSYGVMLLLATNEDSILPTILSRCVRLKLKPLKDSLVKDFLVDSFGNGESKAEVYAAFARGNLGTAIHLASSEEFQNMYTEFISMMKHLQEMDITELLLFIKKMKEESRDIYRCLDFIQLWYRDVLMYKVTQDINLLIFREEFHTMKAMSANTSYEGLERILQAVDKARIRLEANVNMELAMELMLLVMKENGK